MNKIYVTLLNFIETKFIYSVSVTLIFSRKVIIDYDHLLICGSPPKRNEFSEIFRSSICDRTIISEILEQMLLHLWHQSLVKRYWLENPRIFVDYLS